MARVIDKLPSVVRGGSKAERMYPIRDWFDGRAWVILYGEDYKVTHLGMRSTIYNYAKREHPNGYVEIRKLTESGEQIGWALQFTRYEQPTLLRREA